MWTINDFSAYGNLAGCCVKGKYACPIYELNTCSDRLKASNKNVYMGHQRFLPMNHTFRKKVSLLNGKETTDGKPWIISGGDVRLACGEVENEWGKKRKGKMKKNHNPIWKKKSQYFFICHIGR
ncbi:hypothetical protein ACOSQ2_003362 [Xanthoceras sorbifolium]